MDASTPPDDPGILAAATSVSTPPTFDAVAFVAEASKPIPDPEGTDRKEFERFVWLLTGDLSTTMDAATFFDQKPAGKPKAFPKRLRGTVADIWRPCVKSNAEGLGVFLTVNVSNGQSFEDKDIVAARAAFIDDDGKGEIELTTEYIENEGLRPSVSVNSSARGAHFYWLLLWQAGDTLEKYEALLRALAQKFGSDEKVCNRGRVLRAPGTLHQKNKDEPFQVFITDADESRRLYTMDEIIAAFGLILTPLPAAALSARTEYSPPARPRQSRSGRVTGGKPIAFRDERIRRARAYIAGMGPAIQDQGGDLHTFKVLATVLHDFDLEMDDAWPIVTEWNLTCQPPWREQDLLAKCRSITINRPKASAPGSVVMAAETIIRTEFESELSVGTPQVLSAIRVECEAIHDREQEMIGALFGMKKISKSPLW